MIALTDGQTIAFISAAGTIIVAIIGLVGVLIGRQNTSQHNAAAMDRQRDREAREADKQAAIEARREFAEQLNGRLSNLEQGVASANELLVNHISDQDAHGRSYWAA